MLAKLRREVEESNLVQSCGIPQSALSAADSAGSREAYRQFQHLTLAPVAMAISEQIGARLQTPVSFNLEKLMASDLQGRARSFQAMVKGGMAVDRAAALSGLMVE